MKSYLSLIPISAKAHRRQNRMTLMCIVFSVFMVTAVFSMAEMGARMEQTRLSEKHDSFSLQSLFDSAMGQSLLLIAAALFLLILIAGVLMISSSLNSSVAQRTKFFGMMRCLGMSKRQIIHFVRLEALNWCKRAVPLGIALGIVTSWALCAALRFLVGEEFSQIPLFGISATGVISGIVVGVAAVLIAASSPAKRAAKVSPVTAASGDSESAQTACRAVNSHFFGIETALGVHHAVSAKKNLILMVSSFALSIILFLSFSVLPEFVNCLMPQSAGTSDIDISSGDGSNSLDRRLVDTISGVEGVKHVYGRRSCLEVPAEFVDDPALSGTIDLISFDDFDLECLAADGTLKKGSDLSRVYGNSHAVLATWDPSSSWKCGDQIRIGNEELEIAGLLKYDPFSSDGLTKGKMTLITSGETFIRLTEITGYSRIMIQTTADAADESMEAIRGIVGNAYEFSDHRDQSTAGTYLAFVFCVYAFLAIITLVTVLNIVNSISMSVSSRIKQYAAMWAVGMDGHQMTKMIAAEALTYALGGCAVGCAIGLPLNKLLFETLITSHFSYAIWNVPIPSLLILFSFVLLSALAAIYLPMKRMPRNRYYGSM